MGRYPKRSGECTVRLVYGGNRDRSGTHSGRVPGPCSRATGPSRKRVSASQPDPHAGAHGGVYNDKPLDSCPANSRTLTERRWTSDPVHLSRIGLTAPRCAAGCDKGVTSSSMPRTFYEPT